MSESNITRERLLEHRAYLEADAGNNQFEIDLCDTLLATQQCVDVCKDQQSLIAMLAIALGVKNEPHQTFDERLLATARGRPDSGLQDDEILKKIDWIEGWSDRVYEEGDAYAAGIIHELCKLARRTLTAEQGKKDESEDSGSSCHHCGDTGRLSVLCEDYTVPCTHCDHDEESNYTPDSVLGMRAIRMQFESNYIPPRDALEACPFCGEVPTQGFVGDEDGGYHAIECRNCNGSEGRPFIGVHSHSSREGRDVWNRRARPEPAVPEAVRRLPERLRSEALAGCPAEYAERGMARNWATSEPPNRTERRTKLCIADRLDTTLAQQNSVENKHSCAVPEAFRCVDVTAPPEYAGYINLFWHEYPVALVPSPYSEQIKRALAQHSEPGEG